MLSCQIEAITQAIWCLIYTSCHMATASAVLLRELLNLDCNYSSFYIYIMLSCQIEVIMQAIRCLIWTSCHIATVLLRELPNLDCNVHIKLATFVDWPRHCIWNPGCCWLVLVGTAVVTPVEAAPTVVVVTLWRWLDFETRYATQTIIVMVMTAGQQTTIRNPTTVDPTMIPTTDEPVEFDF